jgi:hypothetical protein
MIPGKIILRSIIYMSIALLASQTLSQTRSGYGKGATRYSRPGTGQGGSSGVSSSVRRRVTDETREQSIKGAVGATDEQWKVIKPRLEKVKQLRQEACMVINTGGGSSSGGSSRGSPQGRIERSPRTGGGGSGGGAFIGGEKTGGGASETTKDGIYSWMKWKWGKAWGTEETQREDQTLCYELFNLLHTKNASEEEIRQKIVRLKKARVETLKELAKAQQELREVLTLEQEARLLALGWLE